MKFSATLALVVIVGLVASSSALPAKKRMVYYQQPAKYYAAPQRMMYVQYVQPSNQFARSTQAAEVLVAGESVATGTYLQDCDHAEADISAAGPAVDFNAAAEHGEDILGEAGAHAVQSVAEAYPAAGDDVPSFVGVPAEVDIVAEENEVSNDAAKVPREFDLEAADEAAIAAAAEAEETAEVPAVEIEAPVAAELPVPAPIAPVATPAKRYLPAQKKKVYVELDQSVESDDESAVAVAVNDDEVDEEEEEEVAQVATVVRRPAARKPAKKAAAAKPAKPLPAGTFFPINFGGTAGGAIAIANSFSTGEGGSATSHAIAYGSPDAVRARTRPSKLH